MRIHNTSSIAIAIAAAAAAGFAAPAGAQAMRTWVSGVGDDANPCSRTAPCKTFAGAMSKTADNGEINCLDPGGFGTVTITKSLAILCDGMGGGVMATGTNGIVVNAADDDRVLLSGLDINGGGTGTNGVRVVQARSVVIRNSVIHGFSAAGSRAISVEGPAAVTVAGSAIVNNATGLNGQVVSGGDNLLAGNGTDGQFASTRPRR
jgi:hypothetical protein